MCITKILGLYEQGHGLSKDILCTGLVSPHVIFALLNLQMVSPHLEHNKGERGENKMEVHISLYTVAIFFWGGGIRKTSD